MRRDPSQYANCSPDAISQGSQAQMKFFVEDAKADIAELLGSLDRIARVDNSLATQLRASIEKNAVLTARVAELEATLREHHNWHLQSGAIGLQDGDGGWIEFNNAAEYSDSAMYERTDRLLAGAPPEEWKPMPRGGMNAWWWEQAVLLRRKVRAAEVRGEKAAAVLRQLHRTFRNVEFHPDVPDGNYGHVQVFVGAFRAARAFIEQDPAQRDQRSSKD